MLWSAAAAGTSWHLLAPARLVRPTAFCRAHGHSALLRLSGLLSLSGAGGSAPNHCADRPAVLRFRILTTVCVMSVSVAAFCPFLLYIARCSLGGPMKKRRFLDVLSELVVLVVIVCTGIASRAVGNQTSAAVPCDRACLNSFVDQYLDAVVAHDPSRLAVTTLVKFTEDGQHLRLGDGFWRSATGKGTYKFYVDDPDVGQVGFVGTMREAGQL